MPDFNNFRSANSKFGIITVSTESNILSLHVINSTTTINPPSNTLILLIPS